MIILLPKKEIIFVGITYYLPDYQNLVNEFYCQFDDIVPDIPRVHEFLNYWKNNIEAVIKDVKVSSSNKSHYVNADFYKVLN